MKNYKDGDYAINKNAEGIVYRFADQTIEVTLEDYLRENPNKTPDDFAELKILSDTDYYDTDRRDYRQTWKNIPIEKLFENENLMFSVPSAEEALLEEGATEAAYLQMKSSAALAISKLTEIQKRRYLMYHIQGLSTWEIATLERVNQSKIVKSLALADKKIKKILKVDGK